MVITACLQEIFNGKLNFPVAALAMLSSVGNYLIHVIEIVVRVWLNFSARESLLSNGNPALSKLECLPRGVANQIDKLVNDVGAVPHTEFLFSAC